MSGWRLLADLTLYSLLGALVVLLARNLAEMRLLRRCMLDVAALLHFLERLERPPDRTGL